MADSYLTGSARNTLLLMIGLKKKQQEAAGGRACACPGTLVQRLAQAASCIVCMHSITPVPVFGNRRATAYVALFWMERQPKRSKLCNNMQQDKMKGALCVLLADLIGCPLIKYLAHIADKHLCSSAALLLQIIDVCHTQASSIEYTRACDACHRPGTA